MVTKSVNGVIFDLNDLPGDIDDDGDSGVIFDLNVLPGDIDDDGDSSTKHDTISARELRWRSRSSHQNQTRISNLQKPIQKGRRKGKHSKGKKKPSQPSTFDCGICFESKPLIESFQINQCSHSYCNDCVSKHIAAKLQDNIVSIDCPVSNCPGRLEPEKCRVILPREVYDRWGDALCEALVMRSKRFYCPHKDCSALVSFLDEDENMKESECPHCNRMMCVACGTRWHPEVTCEEFQKLAENERERDDILLKNMAESHKWRRCPSCKFYIEKSQGCLYMKCRCGIAFCYNCETPFKDETHYCYNCKH